MNSYEKIYRLIEVKVPLTKKGRIKSAWSAYEPSTKELIKRGGRTITKYPWASKLSGKSRHYPGAPKYPYSTTRKEVVGPWFRGKKGHEKPILGSEEVVDVEKKHKEHPAEIRAAIVRLGTRDAVSPKVAGQLTAYEERRRRLDKLAKPKARLKRTITAFKRKGGSAALKTALGK